MKNILDHEPHLGEDQSFLRNLLSKYLVFVMLIFYIIQCKYTWVGIGSWDLNSSSEYKWGYLFGTYLFAYSFNALFFFTLSYLILFLRKKYTPFLLSLIHVILVILHLFFFWNIFSLPLFYKFSEIPYLRYFVLLLMWGVFALNLYYSKTNSQKEITPPGY